MNWVDLLLIAVLLVGAFLGWHRGFILGSMDLLAWAASFVLGYLFYPMVADLFSNWFDLGVWLLPVAFLSATVIIRVICWLIARMLYRLIPPQVSRGTFNRWFGIVPGLINGFIFAIFIAALLLALPWKDSVIRETRTSRFAPTLGMQSEWANKKMAPIFDAAIRQTMASLSGQETASPEFVELPFSEKNPTVRPDLERQMLRLVNQERAKEGLPPVVADPALSVVARAHSRDMFARGYFAHKSPDGKDPFDRMDDAKIRFRTAGENLALAQTLEIAHKNLMLSPGHRANIMNPSFGRLGIGILDGGFYGLMISQEFRN